MPRTLESKVGITASAFDLLHGGHIAMLAEAKTQCDYLICCLQVDPSIERKHKNKPAQNIVERYIQLDSVKYVDEIIPYVTERDLLDILMLKKPDVRVIGEEYRDIQFTGKNLDIEIYYNSRQHLYSTSALRKKIAESESVDG